MKDVNRCSKPSNQQANSLRKKQKFLRKSGQAKWNNIFQDFLLPLFFVYCDSLTGQRQVSPKPFGSEIHFSPTEYLLTSWEICKLILSSGDWVCPGVLPGQPFHRFPLGCEEHLLMRLLPWFPLASKSYLLFINSPLIGRLPTLLHPIVTSPGFETIKATELEEKGLCCQM